MTVYSLFKKVISDYSSQTAIITDSGAKLSFSQVADRASKLAAVLEEKYIEKGRLVAILMERNSDYLIAAATCLLYGYPFITMDAEYPKDRIEMILSESQAAFVIDEAVFAESEKYGPLKKSSRPAPEESDNAYAVFTSGSTGRPKGILHDQRSVAEAVLRNVKVFELHNGDIWGATAPFTFVAFIVEIVSTWCAGAAVKVVPRNIVKDPDLLAQYLNENNITVTFIPPRSLRLFKPVGTGLRQVISGGEKICNLAPNGYRLLALYGQSESCGPCVCMDVKKEYDNTPIGSIANGGRLYVLDEDGKESEEGEICISGHFMTCYINLPEATAKTITANPFKEKDGNGELLHTGDLGKRLDDGNIVYINRKDWMIKIGGQRVEPGEIEAVIKKLDGISEAVVKSFVNRFGQTYICAYYTGNEQTDGDSLRRILQEKLPSYMVPSFFIRLEALPLNKNGKLDRNALKEPDTSSFLEDYVAPVNETEAVICRAFAKVLGLSKVGTADNFFRLGGDSLNAAIVATECMESKVSVKHIYTGKTPKIIAELVLKDNQEELSLVSDSNIMPLTDSQMGVYFDCINDEPDCRYNIPFVFSFPKDSVNAEKLRDSLYIVFRNHQAFSLQITTNQGTPVMIKNKEVLPEIEIIEASEEAYEKIKAGFVKPFVIGKDRLYRAQIVVTEHYVYLLADIHHLIFDGTSLGVLQRDICEAYDKGEVLPESVTPFMVSSYVALESKAKEKKENVDYCERILSGCGIDSNINPDLNIPELKLSKGLYESALNIDVKTAEYFTRNTGITENILFASAFAMALAKFKCQTKSLFVSVENGRFRSDMDRSIGMFIRSFPVLVNVEDESKVSDYLKDVQNVFFDSMAHDFVSFSEVVNLSCEIDVGVTFIYQSELLNGFEINGAEVKSQMLPVDETISNLEFMIMKQNGGYKVSVGYRKSMYSQALIESFAGTFNAITDGLVKCAYLKDIKLTDGKQNNLLDSFNRTECEYNSNDSIVDMFKRVVRDYPDNDSVVFKDRKLSYRELDRLSDNLASYIVSQGIKKDSFVAIMSSRTLLMPVFVLGVLKAGCAYQPLDLTYPSERLNFMVNDSKAELIITERDLYPVLTDYKGKVLFADQIESLPDSKTDVEVTPSSRLVLLYTSGTTDLPKGVIITHKNVVSFVMSHRLIFDCNSESRYATYASFGFDAFMMDLFTTLCTGAALYIIPEEIRLDLIELEKFYIDNRITHGFVPTRLGCMFAQTTKSKTLRSFMLGGEKIIPFVPSGNFKVFNAYGPSECTVYATQFQVKDDSTIQPIGKANRNTKLYITDKYNRRMPVGACGELLIAGPQVADGYLNRPEKTQEVFKTNPFTEKTGYERVYRTGDVCRILPDGNVEFIGRRDA